MRVYCVKREWFVTRSPAEDYARDEGVKLKDIVKVRVENSAELAELLNGLCSLQSALPLGNGVMDQFDDKEPPLVNAAPDVSVPDFLRKSWASMARAE